MCKYCNPKIKNELTSKHPFHVDVSQKEEITEKLKKKGWCDKYIDKCVKFDIGLEEN